MERLNSDEYYKKMHLTTPAHVAKYNIAKTIKIELELREQLYNTFDDYVETYYGSDYMGKGASKAFIEQVLREYDTDIIYEWRKLHEAE